MAINPWEVVKGTASAGFDPGAIKAPNGIPESFWQTLLSDPANTKGLHWLEDSTKGGSFDRFANKAQYLEFLQQAAEDQFKRLPAAEQKKYSDADANGGVDPNSVPAIVDKGRNRLQNDYDLGMADWEGANPQEFIDAERAAASGDRDALEHLNELIRGIKDPTLAAYAGDVAAHTAGADPRDIEAQQRQLSKLESLSDPTITAEEKLMNEMARRQTESDLRGQRGAIRNDLLSRGVYGSGAEITQNAMAQQEAAQRQAYEQMQANANAQTRAMSALKGAGDLATSMRGSSASESQYNAGAMDLADQFNKKMMESYNQWKDRTEKETNDRKIGREQTIAGNVKQIGTGGVQAAGDIYKLGADRGIAKAGLHKTLTEGLGKLDDTEMNYYDGEHTKDEVKV